LFQRSYLAFTDLHEQEVGISRKQKPVAGYFTVRFINTVEVAVKKNGNVFSRDFCKLYVVGIGKRSYLVFLQNHLGMVHFQVNGTVKNPDEFIEFFATKKSRVVMEFIRNNQAPP